MIISVLIHNGPTATLSDQTGQVLELFSKIATVDNRGIKISEPVAVFLMALATMILVQLRAPVLVVTWLLQQQQCCKTAHQSSTAQDQTPVIVEEFHAEVF